jgi:hypothetical protein
MHVAAKPTLNPSLKRSANELPELRVKETRHE